MGEASDTSSGTKTGNNIIKDLFGDIRSWMGVMVVITGVSSAGLTHSLGNDNERLDKMQAQADRTDLQLKQIIDAHPEFRLAE